MHSRRGKRRREVKIDASGREESVRLLVPYGKYEEAAVQKKGLDRHVPLLRPKLPLRGQSQGRGEDDERVLQERFKHCKLWQ